MTRHATACCGSSISSPEFGAFGILWFYVLLHCNVFLLLHNVEYRCGITLSVVCTICHIAAYSDWSHNIFSFVVISCAPCFRIVSVENPFPLQMLSICFTSWTWIHGKARVAWSIKSKFDLLYSSTGSQLCKILEIMKETNFGDISLLYESIANRFVKDFAFGWILT